MIYGSCNKAFHRKGWKSGNEYRKVWTCSERYKVKGVAEWGEVDEDDDELVKYRRVIMVKLLNEENRISLN